MNDWAKKQKERQRQIKQIQSGGRSYKWLYLLVLIIGLGLPLVALGAYFFQNYEPKTELEVAGNTITVRKGGDFQAALNQAKSGDIVILEAGATFRGNFILPNKQGNEFITIRSSAADSQLPPAETRIDPKKYATVLPKIITVNSDPAISTAKNAHHYRFIGVEVSTDTDKYVYNLVMLGVENQQMNEIPHHIEIDRSYIHAGLKGKTRRGIALNNSETIIKNSHISGFAYPSEETQAIAGWFGPGPYKILNNYLDAGAENIMFGGSTPNIKGLIPSDIEVRGNLMTKPLEWRDKVGTKCSFELKNARRVTVSGNVIENSFYENAVRLTVRGEDGTAPWATIEDVVMENNIIRNSGGGINILGKDEYGASGIMKRVKIVNNLFLDIDSTKWGGDGRFITISHGEDITIANNTVFHNGNVITAHGDSSKRLIFRDNIFANNNYGIYGDGTGIGKATLAKYFPDGVFSGNIIVNSNNLSKSDVFIPAQNFYAQNFDAVGFVNYKNGDYRLGTSSFKGKGANGKDPGVDFSQFEKLLANKPM